MAATKRIPKHKPRKTIGSKRKLSVTNDRVPVCRVFDPTTSNRPLSPRQLIRRR